MGSHLARRLADAGTDVRLLSRTPSRGPPDLAGRSEVEVVTADVRDRGTLEYAFEGCDAVAHLAGINFERGTQTYEAVHAEGTRNVVAAAETEAVDRLVLSSFLRARPDCASGYHESKWHAEEIVRDADVAHTVLKIGVTYGRGDHLVSHVARALLTVPVFGLVGFTRRRVRPLAVEDLVDVLSAALLDDTLADETVAVTGPEELSLRETVRRIGSVIEREPLFVPVPVAAHRLLALGQELTLETPITSRAQVQMLAEGLVEPAPADVCEPLPSELEPDRGFTDEQIAAALPDLERFGLGDLRV